MSYYTIEGNFRDILLYNICEDPQRYSPLYYTKFQRSFSFRVQEETSKLFSPMIRKIAQRHFSLYYRRLQRMSRNQRRRWSFVLWYRKKTLSYSPIYYGSILQRSSLLYCWKSNEGLLIHAKERDFRDLLYTIK